MAQQSEEPGDNSRGKQASRVAAPLMAGYMVMAVLVAFGLMYLYATNSH